MPRTLIVGFGRAGHDLHWKVLNRLRGTEPGRAAISAEPPVVVDPAVDDRTVRDACCLRTPDLARAAELLDPADTVVHLCTPPTDRLEVLRELATLGFRQILVEKPLISTPEELAPIDALRRAYGLRLIVVAPWLHSTLTERLHDLVRQGTLGDLESVFVAQLKPRMTRTLRTQGHPTAFDVELPHSVGLVLKLAGDGDVAGAELHDMRLGSVVVRDMGAARLHLTHHSSVSTEIFTDLASPIRERVIRLGFSRGWAVGHFPISEADDHAHLSTSLDQGDFPAAVFRDDSLGRFLLSAYQRLADGADLEADFALNSRVSAILSEAKEQSRLGRAADAAVEPLFTADIPRFPQIPTEAVPHAS